MEMTVNVGECEITCPLCKGTGTWEYNRCPCCHSTKTVYVDVGEQLVDIEPRDRN